MSTKYLGNHLDIHGGGIDLAFPHHTNEIAQTEAHTGEKFVEKWLHNGFVTVGDENEKMSKSLGNFTTVHELLQHIDDPMVLRFFMATTQYRRPIAYSQKNIDLAARNLERIRTGYRNLQFRKQTAVAGADEATDAKVAALVEAFNTAMDDDFNAQNAMTEVYNLVELANIYSQEDVVKAETVKNILDTLATLMNVFGVDGLAQEELLDSDIDALIQERDAARETKNFARSDEIRELLAERGIILEDTAQGTRWHR
jgi:cysteinyl-tRNA synthetase